MTTLEKEPYRLFKDRLYRAENAFFLSLDSCDDLENFVVTTSDGRKISARDVATWLHQARENVWRHGPPDVRARKIKSVMREQPRG